MKATYKYIKTIILLALLSVCSGAFALTTDQLLLVTDISTLKTGDKVVLTLDLFSLGVTGQNSSSDATVSETLSEWVQYEVTEVTGGVTLKDPTADQFIASPTGNHFKYSTSGGTCTVSTAGVLMCNSRYLCQNGTYYRMYSNIGTYAPFYVYKIGSGTQYTVTWLVNDRPAAGTPTTTVYGGTRITTLPATPTSADFDGTKKFVGWTNTTIDDGQQPSVLFTTAAQSPVITGNTTFYAVFADKSVTKGTLTYGWEGTDANANAFTNTFRSVTPGTSSAVFAHGGLSYGSNVNDKGNGIAGNGCAIQTKEKYTVTHVEFYYSKASGNTTAQDWVLQTSTDGTNWTDKSTTYSAGGATQGEWSFAEWDLDGAEVYVKVTMNGNSTAVRTIDDLKIEYLNISYSNYATSHNAPAITLIGLEIAQQPTKTVYTVGDALDLSGIKVTALYDDESEMDVTDACSFSPADGTMLNTVGTQTITATYQGESTTTTVRVNEQAKCKISWSVNGTVTEQTEQVQDALLTFPTDPSVEGMVFKGWTTSETVNSDGTGIIYITTADRVPQTGSITYYAVFAKAGETIDVTDVITLSTTGASGTSYADWSGKKVTSDAVYAGNSAGGNSSIQLRGSNSSGIITTTSGGKLKSISLVWNSNTENERQVDVYSKDEPYESAADLYNTEKKGTLVGSIVKGTSVEINATAITDEYRYIGLRSKSNALYLDEISITYEVTTYTGYTTIVKGEEEVEDPLEVTFDFAHKDYGIPVGNTDNQYEADAHIINEGIVSLFIGARSNASIQTNAGVTGLNLNAGTASWNISVPENYRITSIQYTCDNPGKIQDSNWQPLTNDTWTDEAVIVDFTQGWPTPIISTITVKYKKVGLVDPELEIELPTYTVYIDDASFTLPAPTSLSDATISYEAANATIAEFTGSVLSLNHVGETTITATQTDNDEFASGSAECTLKVVPRTVSVNIGSTGWATYAPSYDVYMTETAGASAYYITTLASDNKTVVMSDLGEAIDSKDDEKPYAMAEGTGILVKAPAGTTVQFPVSIESDQNMIIDRETLDNLLVGVTKDTNMAGIAGAYIFAQREGQLGFYVCTGGTLTANKSYLKLSPPAAANAPRFILLFGDETAIEDLISEAEANTTPAYDLTGRQVVKGYRGVAIRRGVKCVIK